MNPNEHFITWIVPDDLPVLVGHFPGDPLLPASSILDWLDFCAQTAFKDVPRRGALQAKFLHPARPGDHLCARLSISASGDVEFEVRIEEQLAVKGKWGKSA